MPWGDPVRTATHPTHPPRPRFDDADGSDERLAATYVVPARTDSGHSP
jgi:hypothetical protein